MSDARWHWWDWTIVIIVIIMITVVSVHDAVVSWPWPRRAIKATS